MEDDVPVEIEEEEEEVENVPLEPAAADAHKIVRNIIVPDSERKTSDMMSRFEMTNAVTIRASQIERFNNPLVDTAGMTDPVKMAKKELMNRRCPLIIRRKVGTIEKSTPEGIILEVYYELWRVNEMKFPDVY